MLLCPCGIAKLSTWASVAGGKGCKARLSESRIAFKLFSPNLICVCATASDCMVSQLLLSVMLPCSFCTTNVYLWLVVFPCPFFLLLDTVLYSLCTSTLPQRQKPKFSSMLLCDAPHKCLSIWSSRCVCWKASLYKWGPEAYTG